MKKSMLMAAFILALTFSVASLAHCKLVYTIGAYDEAFSRHANIEKLGPLPTANVPSILLKSFLEKDGSYGGGEAFCTISEACQRLAQQITLGVLPKTEHWHVYLLDADWNKDVYKLHANDFRIKHPAKVLKIIRKNC